MKDYIKQRVIDVANFTIENNSTVRNTAKKFEVSRSTIHTDLTERLPKIDYDLYLQANKVLQKNKAERHIRGGIATRNKFTSNKGDVFNARPNSSD